MPTAAIQHAFNLALEHHKSGRLQEAGELYRLILAKEPGHAESLHFLGVLAHQAGRNDDAITLIRGAVAANPQCPDAYCNLGIVLYSNGRFDEAISAFRKAVSVNPTSPEAHGNLGNALQEMGHFDEAIAECRRAVALRPDFADGYNNLGLALRGTMQLPEAMACFERSLQLDSSPPHPHWNIANLLLLIGDFRHGWEEFEWRLGMPDIAGPPLPTPHWAGQDPRGKRLLVMTEGGAGDALHFVRYAPLLASRGATVLLGCQSQLATLLSGVDGIAGVVCPGQQQPSFDFCVSLRSLPFHFATTLQTIPSRVPYLAAPNDQATTWRERLKDDANFKVGLAWAGSRVRDDRRSRTLADLAPLAVIPGITFYSLQKGPEANEPPPVGMRLRSIAAPEADFADTAALAVNLDLVITVDTSIAHLAGGLGLPVWTLIPYVPDFRWLLDRDDSPWYPTMRLFRQRVPGDWAEPVNRMAEALPTLIKRK